MDALMERFLKNIHIDDVHLFDGMTLKKCQFHKDTNILEVDLFCPILPSYSLYRLLFDHIETATYKTALTFHYKEEKNESLIITLIQDLLKDILKREIPLPEYIYDKSTNNLCFNFTHPSIEENYLPLTSSIEEFFSDINLKTTISTKSQYYSEISKRDEELKKVLLEASKHFNFDFQTEKTERKRIRGNYVPIQLKDISVSSGNVSFVGKVFYAESRNIKKNDKTLATLYVYDKTGSIEVTAYEDHRSLSKENLAKYQEVGTIIKVRGYPRISNFTQSLQIKADFIEISHEPFDPIYEDTSEEKRVELHLHTKMSTLDGVNTIDDYIKQAKKWGMDAIAITDHGVVQGYPDAQKASESAGIKMIYGTEMYMIEDELKHIQNPSDTILTKANYVIFDLETTGLSSRYDKIIEFGGLKVIDGMEVDRMDILIDPEMPLGEFTKKLTHITDEMVRGKSKIREAMLKIKEFIGDAILVSHNAIFDFGFLNEACKKLNMPIFNNPVIDTLPLSRYMFPNNKLHALGNVAKTLELSYVEDAAHRAIYDAEVLFSVWFSMLAKLTQKNKELKHKDLAKLQSIDISKKLWPMHITCYARDSEGLKDLFRLISKSHIDYFYNGPRIPRSEIEKYRKHLLIGSACFNGEVFDAAMRRGEDTLKEKISFYDFIEVQPLDNYVFLVNDNQAKDMAEIKQYMLDVIKASDEMKKDVVATGDVHYLHPEDKIFRDVYISAKLVGGGHHPLNPYGKKGKSYENPNQHFRSTSEMLECFAF